MGLFAALGDGIGSCEVGRWPRSATVAGGIEMAGIRPSFRITFALGKLVRTLPSAWRGSFEEACPTTARGEAVQCFWGALRSKFESQKELGMANCRHRYRCIRARSVVARLSGVPEESPWAVAMQCGRICCDVCSVRGTDRCSEGWRRTGRGYTIRHRARGCGEG
jgi:hypothetical protein